MKTVLVRFPKIDFDEIKQIMQRNGCSFPKAYMRWKNQKLGIREWENI